MMTAHDVSKGDNRPRPLSEQNAATRRDRHDALAIMCSGAFADVLERLLGMFRSDVYVPTRVTVGSSFGNASLSLARRLREHEPCDLIILFDQSVDALTAEGLLLHGTKTVLASSGIGVAVRQGAPRPDIGTPAALRDTLRSVRSFAYSSSISGDYVSRQLLSRLGLSHDVGGRGRRIRGERVGSLVARGEADLGFQQLSELVAIPGLDVLGPLPDELQLTTLLSAALPTQVRQRSTAHLLVKFLCSQTVHPVLLAAGLQPPVPKADSFR